MGSFHAACGISNLSIGEGDEVGFVILGESPEVRYGKQESGRVLFVYPTDLRQPFLAPVYGKYDDYGNIVEVQESLTTKVIENMFNRPAEVVLKCISSNRAPYSSHGEVFQNYLAVEPTWRDWDKLSPEVLEALGFVKDAGDENTFVFGRFSLSINKPRSFDGIPSDYGWFVSDMLNSRSLATGSMHQDISEVMNEFSDVTKLYPGFKDKDFEALNLLRELDGMFFLKEVYDGMKSYTMEDESTRLISIRDESMWVELMKLVEQEGDEPDFSSPNVSTIFRLMEHLFRDTSFPIGRYIELKPYGRDSEMLETKVLTKIMESVNRMFMPTMCGSPYGNDEASKALNGVSGVIVERRLSESEED